MVGFRTICKAFVFPFLLQTSTSISQALPIAYSVAMDLMQGECSTHDPAPWLSSPFSFLSSAFPGQSSEEDVKMNKSWPLPCHVYGEEMCELAFAV